MGITEEAVSPETITKLDQYVAPALQPPLGELLSDRVKTIAPQRYLKLLSVV
jgi:hypothetical protein